MNQKLKQTKGITLIALVITIIVLLILAGVTMNMVLGDDGIIAQAQSAKIVQKNEEEKQAVKLAIGEAATSQYLETMTKEQVEAKIGTGKFTEANPYRNSLREIKEFGTGENKKYLPIPKGMAYAFGTIDEGAVVVDLFGNEYVWIPVDGDNVKLELNSEYFNPYEQEIGKEPQIIESDVNYEIDEELLNTEYNKMKTSVDIYGGFYVGRYETSWTGDKVASVSNKEAMNGTTIIDGNNSNWYTMYNMQKELHTDNPSIVSGMIYGCQWDAIMDWMRDVRNENSTSNEKLYVFDSVDMGNYDSDLFIETGTNDKYKVKNIYDLAGNYYEWTQEADLFGRKDS